MLYIDNKEQAKEICDYYGVNDKVPILNNQKYENLIKFTGKNMSSFDDSHNFDHVVKVCQNALFIVSRLTKQYDIDIIIYSSILHDVCDHKYDSSITKEQRDKFIENELGIEKMKTVKSIIDNVSYSKQSKGQCDVLDSDTQDYLNIIRDADRIEALGEEGIRRCEQFTLARGGIIPDDVVSHCYDKLLKLYTEGYIVTEPGRFMAKPLHDYVADYVAEYVENKRVN